LTIADEERILAREDEVIALTWRPLVR